MEPELSLREMQKEWHGSLKHYLIGFFASLILTFFSFSIVSQNLLDPSNSIYIVAAFAILQAAFQLIYFLNLGREGRPYWETCIFFFMLLIFFIIACGSLWIMHDLNMRMMGAH